MKKEKPSPKKDCALDHHHEQYDDHIEKVNDIESDPKKISLASQVVTSDVSDFGKFVDSGTQNQSEKVTPRTLENEN